MTQTNIKVAVRVRPINHQEMEQNQNSIIKVLDTQTLLFDPDEDDDAFFFHGTKQNFRDISKRVHKKLSMEFDHVFDTISNNHEIFEKCTAPLIESVLNGYNCSVFVYGATGAGKTFTMLGNRSSRGLTYLTMRCLFEKIENQKEMSKFNIAVTYLEVYNEQVMDLLNKSGPLKLLEDSNGVVVNGLTPRPIFSAEELLDLLAMGNENRTQHPTDANAESSRSHAVFQVHIRITDRKTNAKRTVKLSMIDLAGSERAASTKGTGLRFREGANINKSLLALGNCINKLADGLKHIPYRDSNLTRILKDSLGGNCRTLMIANISMSSLTFEDTYNTLKYASRAKKIRTTLRQNTLRTNMPKQFYIKKVDELMTENAKIKEANKVLESKVASFQNTIPVSSTTRTYDENELKNYCRKIDLVYSNVIKGQEYVGGIQSKIKTMSFILKYKQYAHNYYQEMSFDQPSLAKDSEIINAIFARISKQIEKQTKEESVWRNKLQEAYDDLNKLKKELKKNNNSEILLIYQNSKEWELQHSKYKILSNHVSTFYKEMDSEMKKYRQIIDNSIKYIIQSEGLERQEIINKLQQIMIGNRMLTNETFGSDSDDTDLDNNSIPNNEKRTHSTFEENAPKYTSTAKRLRRLPISSPLPVDFDENFVLSFSSLDSLNTEKAPNNATDFTFKIPMAKKTCNIDLNATHSVSDTIQSVNFTLDSDTTDFETRHKAPVNRKNVPIISKKSYVNSILSENLVKPPVNKALVRQVLMKSKNISHGDVVKTVNLGIQKEIRKHSPIRIRKSPRAMAAKTFTSTISSVKKAFPTTSSTSRNGINGGSHAPIVRINRAASFRTKK